MTEPTKPTKKPPQPNERVIIQPIDAEWLSVPILGTAPLIVHNFSEKARRQMLEAQQGKKKVKEVRDPQAEYLAAFYRILKEVPVHGRDPREPIESNSSLSQQRRNAEQAEVSQPPELTTVEAHGFPIAGFHQATVGAARFYDKSITMTALRMFIFMRGVITKADPQPLVEIVGDPEMREDIVRLGGMSRSADLRYRPEFPQWSCTLTVGYVRSSIDKSSVLSLIDAGGMGIGIGEWRPEKRGTFGTYMIDPSKKIGAVG